jgi:serine/threonine protein kinase
MNSDHDLVVADFGLGRDCLSDSTRKSVAGVGFGTPLYWSPEQSQDGGSATEKSDIYALGRMLYELYTEPLKSVGHDLTRLRGDIAFIVKKCTQVNPDRRFETITALKEAWNQTTDEISDSSLEQQISEVVAVLSTATSLDEGVIRTLIGLLESNAEEKDLIHEAIMQLPPEVVRQCYASDKEATQGIISAFVDYTVKQGWPFSYTDRIGNKCKAIYQEIEDYHIRGELAFCVASTGVSHSRWKVQTVAIELLQHSKLKGEDDVVIDRLDGGSYSIILWIKEKCSLGKLSPKLRCYIERRSRE